MKREAAQRAVIATETAAHGGSIFSFSWYILMYTVLPQRAGFFQRGKELRVTDGAVCAAVFS